MLDSFPLYTYSRMLEPWTRLAYGASDVVNTRLTALPWMWLTHPIKASLETQRMFSEKQDALQETLFVMNQAPMQIWMDTFSALWTTPPHMALGRAMVNSSRRAAHPSSRRVKANQRRLR